MPDNPPINPEEQIFEEALKIEDQEKRSAYLDGACRGDKELRNQLDAMIEAHDGAEGFLDTLPDDQTVVENALAEGPGTQIGKYKLLQQIGVGGMGVVYMAAEEGELRRKVAFKIIKLGMDTKNVVARFEAERQALALMDHRNIAKVFDAGATETGRPYFVMELVKGIPITEYCDKHKLTTEKRLELFIPVCEAIQHAHHKGIIHRDIKPSNVLVAHFDGKPVPMVIDFGIAKATNQRLTEKTQFTEHGQFIGTPAYVSPEQSEGSQLDIDTRSDIYSLGVLLYELLTGSQPFPDKRLRSAGWREMQRIIQEEEPQRPSTRLNTLTDDERTTVTKSHPEGLGRIAVALRRELDWIVMMCLEKDRSRRYETANGLAMDIGRYLKGDAINAVPPSKTYQLSKLVRKHKKSFAMAAAVAVILSVATVVSMYQADRARKAENDATARAVKLAAFNEWMTRHLLPQVDAWTGFEAGQNRNVDIKLKDAILQSVKTLSEDFKDQPVIEGEIRLTVGRAFRSMGLRDEAGRHFERAYELFQEVHGDKHTNTISAKLNFGRSQVRGSMLNGNSQVGLALMEDAYSEAVDLLGPDHAIAIDHGIDLGMVLAGTPILDEADSLIPALAARLGLPDGWKDTYSFELWMRAAGVLASLRRNEFRFNETEAVLDLMYERALKNPVFTNDLRFAELLGQRAEFFNQAGRRGESREQFERRQEKYASELDWAISISTNAVRSAWPTPVLYEQRARIAQDRRKPHEAKQFYRNAIHHLVATDRVDEPYTIQNAERLLTIPAQRGDWMRVYHNAKALREDFGIRDGAIIGAEIWAGLLTGNTNGVSMLRQLLFSAYQTSNFNQSTDGEFNLLALPCPADEIPELEIAVNRFIKEDRKQNWFESIRAPTNLSGWLAYRKGDPTTARTHLETVIKIRGESLSRLNARYFLAMTLDALNDSENAEKELAAANKLLDGFLQSGTIGRLDQWTMLLRALVLRNEAEQTVHGIVLSRPVNKSTLATAFTIQESVSDLSAEAHQLTLNRQFKKALAAYEELMDIPQMERISAIHIAVLSHLLGDKDRTQQALTTYFIPHGSTPSALNHLEWTLLSRFKPEDLSPELLTLWNEADGRQQYEETWRNHPTYRDAGTPLVLGMIWYRDSEREKALEALELPMHSMWYRDPVDARSFAAMAHWKLEQHDQARELLLEADQMLKQRTAVGIGTYQNFNGVLMELSIREADALIEPNTVNAPYVATLP